MKSLLLALALALVSFNSFAANLGQSTSLDKCESSHQSVKRVEKESQQKIEDKKQDEKAGAVRA